MIGQTLSHYGITAALGAGGMGEVCRATKRAGEGTRLRAELTSSILRDWPRPVAEQRPGLPGELDAVLGRCLEKDVHERVQSGGELDDALRALQGHVASGEVRAPARVSSPGAADATPDSAPSIAVLALQNLSAEPDNDYFQRRPGRGDPERAEPD